MIIKTKIGTWRVRWWENGHRLSKTFPIKVLAERFEARTKLKKFDRFQISNHETPTFREYSERWHRDYCKIEKSESQWAENLSVIRNHLIPSIGSIAIGELRRSHLLRLKLELQSKTTMGYGKKPLKPKSINNIIALAKKMMSTAVDWELIPANPFVNVKPLKVGDQPYGYWTPSERDRFIRFCKELDPAFSEVIIVGCYTGLRWGELAALTRGDLDFERKMVKVRATHNFALKKTLPRTKNKESRDIPMNSEVRNVLKSRVFAAADALVFDRKLLYDANKRLTKLCIKTGTKRIPFHGLRHTFGSALASAGVSTIMSKELMRHKSIAMTMRYSHLDPSFLKDATEILCEPRPDQTTFGPLKNKEARAVTLTS